MGFGGLVVGPEQWSGPLVWVAEKAGFWFMACANSVFGDLPYFETLAGEERGDMCGTSSRHHVFPTGLLFDSPCVSLRLSLDWMWFGPLPGSRALPLGGAG